jgi:O-antigen/teichoic acid export membrane protein
MLAGKTGTVQALGNVVIRGSSLALRFGISIYIIKFLGLEAAGLYGLCLGASGMIPAVAGFGLNYFVAREVVDADRERAASIIFTRLIFTSISLILLTLLFFAFMAYTDQEITTTIKLMVAIVWLESFGLDLHLPMIALGRIYTANLISFIRLGSWIPFAIGFGLLYPDTRNLNVVLLCWVLGNCAALLITLVVLRDVFRGHDPRALASPKWLLHRLRNARLIYISDVSLIGMLHLDKYMVTLILGLNVAGVYTFFSSLTGALQTLVSSAVIQPALPTLFKAFNSGSESVWKKRMISQVTSALAISAALGVFIFVGNKVLVHFVSMNALQSYDTIFILLIVGAIVRAGSDTINVGLTSLRQDRTYAVLNIFGVLFMCACTPAMLLAFGFWGVGISAVVGALVVAFLRSYFLRRKLGEISWR